MKDLGKSNTVKKPFKEDRGAMDVASTLFAVAIVAVASAMIAIAFTTLIPWIQDTAAKKSLAAIATAQDAAMMRGGSYLDKAGLTGASLVSGSALADADIRALETPWFGADVPSKPTGSHWVAFLPSGSGKVFSTGSGTDNGTIEESSPKPHPTMVTRWDTSIEDCQNLALPVFRSAGGHIEWGDGTKEELSDLPEHSYQPGAGTVTVKINGFFDLWGSPFQEAETEEEAALLLKIFASNKCLLSVDQWENTQTTSLNAGFMLATSLTKIEEIPDTVTNLFSALALTTNFNDDISDWDVSKVTDMSGLFMMNPVFNQPLNSWDTSSVTSIEGMFLYTGAFNQPLNNWDTSSVTRMGNAFAYTEAFNQPLDQWDTSQVTDMMQMFMGAKKFSQDLNGWNVSKVEKFPNMFAYSVFNGHLDEWNTSSALDMSSMFYKATQFNQPLGSWNVSTVTKMVDMFAKSAMNQNLSSWNVANVTDGGLAAFKDTPMYTLTDQHPAWNPAQ